MLEQVLGIKSRRKGILDTGLVAWLQNSGAGQALWALQASPPFWAERNLIFPQLVEENEREDEWAEVWKCFESNMKKTSINQKTLFLFFYFYFIVKGMLFFFLCSPGCQFPPSCCSALENQTTPDQKLGFTTTDHKCVYFKKCIFILFPDPNTCE